LAGKGPNRGSTLLAVTSAALLFAGVVAAPTAAAATAPKGCTGSEKPIIVGTVGTNSGVLGAYARSGIKALQAWSAWLNDKGGINCHKVKYQVGDDGADPARHQALVRQFVEQDKVIAFLFNDAPVTGQASVEYLKQKQVPAIGQEGGQFAFYDSPVHFATGSAGVPLQWATVDAGAQVTLPEHKTKLAMITCQEVEYCNRADKTYPQAAPAAGYKLVYRAKGTLVQPDYTAQCLGAKNAGADVLVTAFDPNSDHRLFASCAKVGYHPTGVVTSLQSSIDFKDDPNLTGMVINSNYQPWFMSGLPGVAEYQNVLRKYSPGSPFESSGMHGWAAGRALEHALVHLASDQAPASAAVLVGMNSMNGDTLGGITYPLHFAAGRPHKQVACGWTVVVAKGTFTSDGKMFCVKGYEP